MTMATDSPDDLCMDEYERCGLEPIASCDGCGSQSPLSMIEVIDDAVGYQEYVFLCERCMEKRAR